MDEVSVSLGGLPEEARPMDPVCRFLLYFAFAGTLMFVSPAHSQDAPSLGDVARQARQQKQQKDDPAKIAQPGDVQSQNTQSSSSQNKDGQGKDAESNGSQSKEIPSKNAPSKGAPSTNESSKDAQPRKASHVITNDELPQHTIAGVKPPSAAPGPGAGAQNPVFDGKFDGKPAPDEVKSQIQDQKSAITALQSQINELNDSIHFAGANCVANCVAWNENQQAKQRQVEDMRSQLENAKQTLEQMQDYARKAGFGSSVYDPEQ
jgi:hypothetical protein